MPRLLLDAGVRSSHPSSEAPFRFPFRKKQSSSLKSKAHKVVIKEAKDLCQRLWNSNKTISITFSGILCKKALEGGIVVEINDRLRQMTTTDDRHQLVDFSGVLNEDRWFRSDGVHLLDAGMKDLARCFNDFS